jgi:hypothetical protein
MPKTKTEKVHDLLSNMAFENPPPEEKWFNNSDFDPTFGRVELRAALEKGLIEIEDAQLEHLSWRFRFTPKGRQYFVDKGLK